MILIVCSGHGNNRWIGTGIAQGRIIRTIITCCKNNHYVIGNVVINGILDQIGLTAAAPAIG